MRAEIVPTSANNFKLVVSNEGQAQARSLNAKIDGVAVDSSAHVIGVDSQIRVLGPAAAISYPLMVYMGSPDGVAGRIRGGTRMGGRLGKVRDYLLSPEHPVGRSKARFFASLGFTRAGWAILQRALLTLAAEGDAAPGPATAYGQKYEVRGMLQGLAG